jgi:iron complex outermembrane receptor protein
MVLQAPRLASALVSACAAAPLLVCAQSTEQALPEVTVTATPSNANAAAPIAAPASVLSGDALQNRLGSSLGETLSHELGVSTSGFGAAASRPVIRGFDGPRIKILQNGMSSSDVSSISSDHAVATDTATAQQIEILRGPAALQYGSGALGGLVNVVNGRIPNALEPVPTGEANLSYGSVDKAKSASFSIDGSAGRIGLHLDGDIRNTSDYRIPDSKALNDPASASGRLPLSFTHQNNVGVGASYIDSWGYAGASVTQLNNLYGVPTLAGSQIDQRQTRYDIDTLIKQPAANLESFRFRLGYTDYKHSELGLDNIAQTNFSNRALETRWEFAHKAVAGWRGIFGMQTEDSRFSALNAQTGERDTVPPTDSRSFAGFLIEERDFGPVHMNAGLRLESVKREPATGLDRSFNLSSYSLGGLWAFTPGYGFGVTASVAQRAPAIEELYSQGPHDATGTFDIGNPGLNRETSHNIELSLQKTTGLVRWKANVFQNRVRNFIFGDITGVTLDEAGNPGTEFGERIFSQADATIRGAEAEISYNLHGPGASVRAFADTSRGTFDHDGNLPLQPATRLGVDLGYRQGQWNGGMTLLRARSQDRIAAFETTTTPGYTELDANLSYTQQYGGKRITWFAIGRNLLNQDIRYSTSLLKDVAPLPGRNLIVGVRTSF